MSQMSRDPRPGLSCCTLGLGPVASPTLTPIVGSAGGHLSTWSRCPNSRSLVTLHRLSPTQVIRRHLRIFLEFENPLYYKRRRSRQTSSLIGRPNLATDWLEGVNSRH